MSLNLIFSSCSCPPSSALVLRQWRSDGGRLLHADTVEHEPDHVRMWTSWGYNLALHLFPNAVQPWKYLNIETHIDRRGWSACFTVVFQNINCEQTGCCQKSCTLQLPYTIYKEKCTHRYCGVCSSSQGFWQEVTSSGCSMATWTSVWPSLPQKKERKSAGKRKQSRSEQQKTPS